MKRNCFGKFDQYVGESRSSYGMRRMRGMTCMATGDDFTLCDDSTGSDREFGEEKLCSCFLNGSRYHIHFVASASSQRRTVVRGSRTELACCSSHTLLRLIFCPSLTSPTTVRLPPCISGVPHVYDSCCFPQTVANKLLVKSYGQHTRIPDSVI